MIDPELISAMLAERRRDDHVLRLTPWQREVLALMAEGRCNSAIAAALVVSEKEVVEHVSTYDALRLPDRPADRRRVLAVVRSLSGMDRARFAPAPAPRA